MDFIFLLLLIIVGFTLRVNCENVINTSKSGIILFFTIRTVSVKMQ